MPTLPINKSMLSVAILVNLVLTQNAFAEKSVEEEKKNQENVVQETPPMQWGGSITLGYDSNYFKSSDYRSNRAMSFHGSLFLSFSENYSLYSNTGGYRTFQKAEGYYSTDTVVGLKHASVYSFGDTGNVSLSGQFTVPTSEASKDARLNTAFRVQAPVSFKLYDIGFTISPRVRKNFHEYTTSPSDSVYTSWGLSLFLAATYSMGDAYFVITGLGGTSINYNDRWDDGYSYGGSLTAGYNLTDNLSLSLSTATSGVYADAAQGTLGSFDLFDDTKATYSLAATYSF